MSQMIGPSRVVRIGNLTLNTFYLPLAWHLSYSIEEILFSCAGLELAIGARSSGVQPQAQPFRESGK